MENINKVKLAKKILPFLTTKYEQKAKLEHLDCPKVWGHKPTCAPHFWKCGGTSPRCPLLLRPWYTMSWFLFCQNYVWSAHVLSELFLVSPWLLSPSCPLLRLIDSHNTQTTSHIKNGSHIFSCEPFSKTGYWLGVCYGWFHLHGLTRAARSENRELQNEKVLPISGLELATIYSYIVQCESMFAFCCVFSIIVIQNGCHFAVWPISIDQTAKWHPFHMITLRNTWQNENSLPHCCIVRCSYK